MVELLNIDCMAGRVRKRKGHKLSEETKAKIGNSNKGKLKGRKRTPESIAKTVAGKKKGKYFNCLVCNAEFWRSPSNIKNGNCKFCSRECYLKWQIGRPKSEAFKAYCRARTGDKCPTWKGGITPEHMRIRNSLELRTWRKSVFLRDNYICQDCQAKSEKGKTVYLHAHHLKSFSEYPELRFEINNGVTLCKKCHYTRHTNQK
jgi:5-methylcytosine-specific restriction endonuclease McrA